MIEEGPPNHGEAVPPDGVEDSGLGENLPSIPALVSDYTNRPDLFLAEVERHDPGFIMRMNQSSIEDAAQADIARPGTAP